MSKKTKVPFKFGDIVEFTEDVYTDFMGENFDKGDRALVTELDIGGGSQVYVEKETEDGKVSDWLSDDELESIKVIQKSCITSKPAVEVEETDKEIVIHITR